MSPNQTRLRELRDRQSRERQRMAELSQLETLDDPARTELDALEAGTPDLERQLRAAARACESDDQAAEREAAKGGGDPQLRERLQLRSRCRIGRILNAQIERQPLDGAERELQKELKLGQNEIPISLWDSPIQHRSVDGFADLVEHRADAATVSPAAGVGQNLRPIFPRLLARSVATRFCGVAMPTVGSGTYATLRQNAGLTASAQAKGGTVESTAATFVSKTTTPHRVSARLTFQLEDKALIGTTSFESRLRSNLSHQLAAQLDNLALNGDPSTTAAEPQGIIDQLTDPANPTAVADFDSFISLFADGIDGGPLAESMMDVRVLANADVARLASKTFRDMTINVSETDEADSARAAVSLGSISAASYLEKHSGGLMGHSRMPATASDIAACIRMRLNAMAMGEGAITYAECPVWQGIEMIVDPYSNSAEATTHFTLHLLIGDILMIQPDAYERIDLKVS